MTERDFELLLTLEQTKNITRAADALFVTQSSLSKRIAALEEELQVTLLLRSRQGIHFTPEGEEVLHYVKEAAAQLETMRVRLDASRDYVCGTLTAGLSVNYAMYRLPDVLALYRSKYPRVSTHIITDHSRRLYHQITDGELDLAIIRGEFDYKENKILLDREAICRITPPGADERELRNLPYIGRKSDSSMERHISQWFHENNLSPDSITGIYVDSISTCVELVKRGIGWTIVPEICLDKFEGDIVPLHFANGEPWVRSTYLMYSDTSAELPQVKAFIDLLTAAKNN